MATTTANTTIANNTTKANNTTPNATTPNATTPNATTPNATTPNATTPNATTPNATTPNATTTNATTPNATTPNATTTRQIKEPIRVDSNNYNISNSDHFEWLLMNQPVPENNNTLNYKITQNIDMKNKNINITTPVNLFNIIIDGNNYTISNLNINNALFNMIAGGSEIKNCKFKNISIKEPSTNAREFALFNNNSGKISNCSFDSIRIEHKNNNDIEFIGIITGSLLGGEISNCNINNVTITSDQAITCGVVCGSFMSGIINKCILNAIKINCKDATIGSISGEMIAGEITNCNINNVHKIDGGIIVGKINQAEGIIIKCITFKTESSDEDDRKGNLNESKKIMAEKKENDEKKKKGLTTTGVTTTGVTTTGVTTTGVTTPGVTTKGIYRGITIIKTLGRNLDYNKITISNIYKFSSKNKISDWIDMNILPLTITFGDPCELESPKIKVNNLQEADVDKYVKKIKEDLLKKIRVKVTSEIKNGILYITIEDEDVTTSAVTTKLQQFSNFKNNNEHFSAITEVVYIYKTSDNSAVMDVFNDLTSVDNSYALSGIALIKREDETSSHKIINWILIVLILILIIISINLIKVKYYN
jgi:hypothetical protein